MNENELLINRLAFRCNQRSKNNKGAVSHIHRILKNEMNITSDELDVFDARFFLLDTGISYKEIIRTCLEALLLDRKDLN